MELLDPDIYIKMDYKTEYNKMFKEKEMPPKNLTIDDVRQMLRGDDPSLVKFNCRSFYPNIEKVIINNRTTVVIWSDGTKTISRPSKEDSEKFDPETGLAICIAKKFLGSRTKLKDMAYSAWTEGVVNDTVKTLRKETKKLKKKTGELHKYSFAAMNFDVKEMKE